MSGCTGYLVLEITQYSLTLIADFRARTFILFALIILAMAGDSEGMLVVGQQTDTESLVRKNSRPVATDVWTQRRSTISAKPELGSGSDGETIIGI